MVLAVALVLSWVCLLGTACGGGGSSAVTTSTRPRYHSPPLRSYLSESANDVYLVQLQEHQPVGILEELLGPAVAPDHVYRDWVYRIVGSQSGEVVTYHLTVISPGAPPLPQTMTAVLTARSVTLGPPFGPGSGVVLTASTQQLYDLAARAHVKSWTGDYG